MSTPTEIVQSMYAAFGRGDVSALLAHLTDGLQWERTRARPHRAVFECDWVRVFQLREGKVCRFVGTFDTAAAAAARAA